MKLHKFPHSPWLQAVHAFSVAAAADMLFQGLQTHFHPASTLQTGYLQHPIFTKAVKSQRFHIYFIARGHYLLSLPILILDDGCLLTCKERSQSGVSLVCLEQFGVKVTEIATGDCCMAPDVQTSPFNPVL